MIINGLRLALAVVTALSMFGYCHADENAHAGHSHKKGASHAGYSHDGHHLCEADIDMPKNYAAALKRIKECRATIGEEISEGHWDELHAPLDEATIILNKIMPIARSSGVPKTKWQEINVAAKDLKKRLDGVHTSLHKSGKVDFNQQVKSIDEAIDRLEAVVPGAPATAKRPAPTTR